MYMRSLVSIHREILDSFIYTLLLTLEIALSEAAVLEPAPVVALVAVPRPGPAGGLGVAESAAGRAIAHRTGAAQVVLLAVGVGQQRRSAGYRYTAARVT